jgi:hypothetical protein
MVGKPDTLSSARSAMSEALTLMRAVYGGTPTMRESGQDMLPQYENETDARYQQRLAKTFALNKLRDAVETASAKPFESLVEVISPDADLALWQKDIDLRGTHLHAFGLDLFQEAVLLGHSSFLVDHPSTTDMPNLKAQRDAGMRPFFKHIPPDSVVAAYDEKVGGQTICRHLRFRDSRIEFDPNDEFKEVVFDQIYVVEVEPGAVQGVVQLYETKRGSTAWALIGEQPMDMDEVPFVTFYAGKRQGSYQSIPPFQDLAYKQVEHWQSSSDQRNILSAARFPMLAASGVYLGEDDENASPIEIGPYKILYSPEKEGKWYYVEPTGKAIDAGAKDLQSLEFQMDFMSLNPVVGTHRQYVPMNERELQERRVNAVIKTWAMNSKLALERGFYFAGKWLKRDYSQVQVHMNTDIDVTMLRQKDMDNLLKSFEDGAITAEELREEMRDRGLLARRLNVSAELEQDADVVAAGGAPAGSAATTSSTTKAKTATKAAASGTPTPAFSGDRPKKQI